MATATINDWGSVEWKEERDQYLREWIGNEFAFRFLMDVSDICELWDDIIDEDKVLGAERVHKVFTAALVSLPANPFYMEHRGWLTPIILTSINSWLDANELQTGTTSERAIAYSLRNRDVQLVQAIIYITRGQDFLRSISPQLWRMFASEQDDAIEWIEGVTK